MLDGQFWGPERCKPLSGWWQENDLPPCLGLVWRIQWETKSVFLLPYPLPVPSSLLSASNCNLSLDPEPGVQIRDRWLRFSSETWARSCWWASLAEVGLLKAKWKIICQPGAWLFFITNFLISLPPWIKKERERETCFQFLLYGIINQGINKCGKPLP